MEMSIEEMRWTRPVSDRGQITLPIKIRESLGSPETIDIVLREGNIIIEKTK